MKRGPLGLMVALVVLAAVAVPAHAEDVEKKWRIGVALGGVNAVDDIESDAGNRLVLVDNRLEVVDVFVDPRNDRGVFGKLDVQDGLIATVSAQYALTKRFLIEASLGYQKSDIGDVEMQVQFDGVDVPQTQSFDFSIFRIPVGEIERVPIEATAIMRFRPRSSFNPYVGLGVGYSVIGFKTDPAFDTLSRRLDASVGAQASLTSAFQQPPAIIPAGAAAFGDLTGARIEAQDTYQWQLVSGAELNLRRKLQLTLDLRYTEYARDLIVGFNNGQDLGLAVPQFTAFETEDIAFQQFGPVQIAQGGLVDGGSLQPEINAPPGTDCNLTPTSCTFDRTMPDGELDTGYYYLQGGELEYDGVTLQIGLRYTF